MDPDFIVCDGVVVPESPLLRRQKANPYGTIEDLPEEELADPDELERMVYKEMWGPILALPVQRHECPIRPSIEDGHVNWGAFGSIDFERYRGQFDKARYKAEQMKERLKDLVNMLYMISDRIPGTAKYRVLKSVRQGVIELEQIVNSDMRALAELYLRALKLRKEIARLQEQSRQRRQKRAEAAWRRLIGEP